MGILGAGSAVDAGLLELGGVLGYGWLWEVVLVSASCSLELGMNRGVGHGCCCGSLIEVVSTVSHSCWQVPRADDWQVCTALLVDSLWHGSVMA